MAPWDCVWVGFILIAVAALWPVDHDEWPHQ